MAAQVPQPSRIPRFSPAMDRRSTSAARSIVLHWEQGLGDTLQFIRFAPQVAERGGRVWVFCQPPLARLVARCEGVDRVFDGTTPLPPIDAHAPLMSVPAIIGTTLSTLPQAPYLSADAATIEQWRGVLARALDVADLASVYKIGIAWQGNPQNKIDRWRSFPLELLAPLAEIAGVRLISLQKGPGTEQIRALDGRFPVAELDSRIEGLEDRRDFLDTAAVMSLLDLVVTPETAVAHLAGALAVKCWVALCHAGDWRWMADGDQCSLVFSASSVPANHDGSLGRRLSPNGTRASKSSKHAALSDRHP